MSIFKFGAAAALLALAPVAAVSQNYDALIDESFLADTFTISAPNALKMAECEEKTHPTCTYVWGVPSDKDAARISMGLSPEGNKLMVIFAQTRSAQDWERVISVYSDAESVQDLGEIAVWSSRRSQISLMNGEGLVIHVHIDGEEAAKEQAILVANHVLAQL